MNRRPYRHATIRHGVDRYRGSADLPNAKPPIGRVEANGRRLWADTRKKPALDALEILA